MEDNYKVRVGITQGDINGIGYEVILKTLSDPRIVEVCTPIVYGSPKVAAYHRKALDLPSLNFTFCVLAVDNIPHAAKISSPRDERIVQIIPFLVR